MNEVLNQAPPINFRMTLDRVKNDEGFIVDHVELRAVFDDPYKAPIPEEIVSFTMPAYPEGSPTDIKYIALKASSLMMDKIEDRLTQLQEEGRL